MKHCSQCGASVEIRIPEGDTRERHVCATCGQIHYSNPRMVVGCIAEWEGKILLCKRAIQPRQGYWTLPAGFLEHGETTEQGAARETLEEACAQVDLHAPFALFSVPHIGQVHIFYRARVVDGAFGVGHETLDAALFDEEEVPWDTLAFSTVLKTLGYYFADRRAGPFGFHTGTICGPPRG